MAEKEVHPGSALGDFVEEFKRLPTWGKVLAGLALVAAAGIGYYEYRNNQTSSSGISGAASPSTDTTGATSQQGAMIGNVPQIPGGLSPQYNPTTGVLEGYQPTPTIPTTTTLPTSTPPPVTKPGGKNPPTTVPSPRMQFVTVTKYPSQLGTLSGIAQANNVPLATVEKLNPQITNPNLIQPGQRVRIA